jgi:hypothetical protein
LGGVWLSFARKKSSKTHDRTVRALEVDEKLKYIGE